MPGPVLPGTLPDTFNAWVQLLQSQGFDIQQISELGITTIDGLKNWVAQQGYQIIPITQQVEQTVGYTFAKISPADAANTDLESMEVIYEVAKVAGGQAVSEVISGRNKIIGAVSKFVAVGACLSLLIESIGSFLVPDEIQEDLITSADPYTIDGENVLVLIDENGKTHFLEEMVEAIRAKAIELGIFDSDTYYHIDDLSLLFESGAYNQPIYTCDLSKIRNTYTGGSTAQVWRFEVSNTPASYKTCILVRETGTGTYSYQILLVSTEPLPSGSSVNFITVNETTGTTLTQSKSYTRSTTKDGKTIYYSVLWDASSSYNLPNWNNQINILNYMPSTSSRLYRDISNILLYGAEDGGEGVEGITPAQDLIAAGVADATKPLTEVLPQLAQGQISIASPTENDLTHKSNWYPVSINSEDVFTDGVTEEETSSATDGDVKEDLQPAILDAINELIEQLNPDGIPDIPVSDSGDTPPENPPLTPSSGGNGSNGLWAIYNPTLTQVQDFGAWLWSDSLADQFKRIFNSPIDGVIGFHMLYCTPSRGADQTIKCGFLASPVTSRTVSSPYVEIDCGTVNIGEFYRNALDYDYTRISVYLPFIGIVPLDTNVVMGSDLNITYRVDVLTGTCLAQIKVIKENSDAVMYAFEGNCAVQIPLTATTYTGMVGALMSGVSAGIGVMTGNIAQAVTSGANALANMVSGKSGVKQSGTMGANAGALGIRKPYVIITHPIAYMPVDFNKLEGLPSNITATLGSLTGFTRVRSVHLENIGTATQEEINMIEELLKEGVII